MNPAARMPRIKIALRILIFVLLAALAAFYVAVILAALVAVNGGSTEFGLWIFRMASGHTAYFIAGVTLMNVFVGLGAIRASRRAKGWAEPPKPGDVVRARMARRRTARNVAWRYAERRG
jgi:hypothetical protein